MFSEKTVGVESFIYGFTQTSFLQLSGSVLSLRGGLAKFEAFQEDLGKCEDAKTSKGDDPFAKVKV